MNLNKHEEFFDPQKIKENHLSVNIIGVGAVGSTIAIQLAKLGISELTIWDFDTVDDHNITNQIYDYTDLNLPKVDALEKHLKASNPEMIVRKKGRWEEGDSISGIVFLEVDSMKVRQAFVDDNEFNDQIELLIDGRIGLETGEVHVCKWNMMGAYEAYREKVFSFNDGEASVAVSACGTTLSVSPSVYITAAVAVAAFINFINKVPIDSYVAFNAFTGKMRGVTI